MSIWLLFGIGVSLVIIALIAIFVIIYNNFIRLRKDIDRAWANIDVILKQRHDELGKLIEVCKAYMKYERSILEKLTELRSQWMKASTRDEQTKIANEISRAIKELFAVAENYPKLRANENFLQLQERISGLENELADRREFYNDCVTSYNIRLQSIPDLIVAKLMKLKPMELFKVAEEEKKDVEIKFE